MALKGPAIVFALLVGAAALALATGRRGDRPTTPAGARETLDRLGDPGADVFNFGPIGRDAVPRQPTPDPRDITDPRLFPITPADPTARPQPIGGGGATRPPVSLPITGPISPGIPAFGPDPIPGLFIGPDETPVVPVAPRRRSRPPVSLPITGPISPGIPSQGPEPFGAAFPIIDIEIGAPVRATATVGNPAFGPQPSPTRTPLVRTRTVGNPAFGPDAL